MHKLLLFLLLSLLARVPLWGQTQTEARKFSNEFLRIGVGARAFGMGNAAIGATNDVGAGYWNPAALAGPQQDANPQVALMHAAYFANIAAYNYGGFAMGVDSAGDRRFGVTLIRMGIDDIPNTLNLIEPDGTINYDRITSFSETQLAALFSYAWRVRGVPGLSFGTNFKLIYRGVGRFANAWGFGLDAGAYYERKSFQAGLVVTDLTNTFNAWTFNTETFEEAFIQTGNVVPQNSIELTRPSVRLGLAYRIPLAKRMQVLAAVDTDVYLDGRRLSAVYSNETLSLDPRAGLEFAILDKNYQPVAFLRGGVMNLQNDRNTAGEEVFTVFPTAGAGFMLKNFRVDYALSNIGNLAENLHSHVVSLTFTIE